MPDQTQGHNIHFSLSNEHIAINYIYTQFNATDAAALSNIPLFS